MYNQFTSPKLFYMKQNRLLVAVIFFSLFTWSCSSTISQPSDPEQNAGIKGLKEYYKDYFDIGVAVSKRSLTTDEAGLILHHFNSITAENDMKMGPIHPGEDQYNWR